MQSKHYSDKLLEVRDLKVSFPTSRGVVRAVNGISYDVHRGEVMGIVGESGSGKSVSAYSIIGLLKSPAVIDGGSIRFEGRDILSMSRKQMEISRWRNQHDLQDQCQALTRFLHWTPTDGNPAQS